MLRAKKEDRNRHHLLKSFTWVVVLAVILFTAVPALCGGSNYAGTYSGTFTGGDSGLWIALIESSGDVLFISWSTVYEIVDGALNETISASGEISAVTQNGADLDITVDLDGTVAGTWTGSGLNGTFTGDKCDASLLTQLAGVYTGSISGGATGTFSLTVDSDGRVNGTITTADGSQSVVGGLDDDSNLILAADNGTGILGSISADGTLNGNWVDPSDGSTGGFVGSSEDSGGGDSGGDGGDDDDGGGSDSDSFCFIRTMK
jgi:hypothetical protein